MSKKETKKESEISKKLKKIYKHPLMRKVLVIVGAVLAGLAMIIFIFNVIYGQKIFPKTYVGDINLGGKTLKEAELVLSEKIDQAQNKEIVLTFENKTWPMTAVELEIKYNAAKSAELAWNTGRHGNLKKILLEQLRSIFSTNKSPAVFVYNQEKLDERLKGLAEEVDIPEKDANVVIENLVPRLEPEKIGRRLDLAQNSQAILNLFGQLSLKSTHSLIVVEAKPKISEQFARQAYNETLKILEGEISIQSPRKDFTLGPDNFADWLVFGGEHPVKGVLGETTDANNQENLPEWILEPRIDQEKIRAYVADLAAQINQEARDAKFNMTGGRVSAFQTSQTGYELDQEQAIKVISEAILKNQTTVELPVKVTEPTLTASSAGDMGIKEVVGQGTTHYYNSPVNRRHNIKIGAKALHGIILKPDEEFSTLKFISPVDAEHGYLPELVILDNRTKPEYGGGLCQVSTTLFRAALNAGLKITDRSNHSYRVGYYEPPIGMDATIYEPNPDFKFVNNYDHPILIQADVDDGESAITFTFYGTKDKRTIEISNPVGYNYVGAGDPVYIEDPNLAAGEIKQIEKAHGGAKASFNYKVTIGNTILQETVFKSDYTAWPARYLYGPGTEIPPAE